MANRSGGLFFYVGTYGRGAGRGIHLGRLDAKTGVPEPIELAAEAGDPTFLALAPGGRFLYAALEGTGEVAAFRVKPDRTLAPLNTRPAGGAATCHVSVAPDGRTVYAANYRGGSVASFPVGRDGALGERGRLVFFSGAKPRAHAVCPDPEGGFVYACDLGADRIHALTPGLNPTGTYPAPAGAGPRHLAFAPDGRFLYVIHEMGISVTAFARDARTGTLAPGATVPLLPEPRPGAGGTGAEIVVHPSGRWLYASVRDHDVIAVLEIGGDGNLTPVETVSAGVKGPRSIAVDPQGRWLLSAGQHDGRVAVLRIDATTGRLAATGGTAAVDAPVCVLFASAGS